MPIPPEPPAAKAGTGEGGLVTVALAGNANVGKSALFNQLTGSSQVIGNWPGKTVERAEGTLVFEGQRIRVVDLPGIYSFSTFGMEEQVSREYISTEKPDVVINVIDATVLERNLFFTLQLLEMGAPLVVCLNQVDMAKRKGISIDARRLSESLGAPVVPTVAVRGEGITELMREALRVARGEVGGGATIRYGAEIEERIASLEKAIVERGLGLAYPPRWVAIKLLEGDHEMRSLAASRDPRLLSLSKSLADEISRIHGEESFTVIASERYSLANRIAAEVQRQSPPENTISERLDWLTTHSVLGYFTSAGVIAALLLWTFFVGNFLSGLFSAALAPFGALEPQLSGSIEGILWNGVYGGLVAGLTLIVPYVIPFFMMLALIENSGVLTRVAFMMDSAMHRIGLHGKALIPLILGFGCNVPAIRSTRIMETKRERLLASFAITFAPCAARTILVLGLVSAFLGAWWALALYALDLGVIFLLGRLAMKVVPGKSTGLIMEMHPFKLPSFSIVAKQTWHRTKSIVFLVLPIYILGSALVQTLYALGVLQVMSEAMSPLTVSWLGLPAATGILLILGLVRKEMILLTAVAIFGSTNLALFLSPAQLVVLALIGMLYMPCLSTIAVLAKDYGWRAAGAISAANLASALVIGGAASRLLPLMLGV